MLTRRISDQVLPRTVSPKSVWPTSAPGCGRPSYPTLLGLGLIGACLVAEAAILRVGIDDLDEGYFVQQAVRVLHGQLPYRDFDTLYSPGVVYVHAALFSLAGGTPLILPRAVAFVARAGIAGLLYTMARPLVRQPLWAAAPSLVLLVGLDDAPVRWEPHPGWLSTLFALAAVWCLSRAKSTRWFVLSGLSVAIAYAFKQNTGFFVLGAILLYAGRARFAIVSGAFVATTLLWLLPLAIALDGQFMLLGALIGQIEKSALWSAPDITNLLPLACIAAGAWLIRRGKDRRLRLYLVCGAALYLTEFPRMDTPHLVWSAPLLLVLGAAALDRVPARASAIAIGISIVLLTPTSSSRLSYLLSPRATLDGVEAPVATVENIDGVVADIQRRTEPGEPIFVYPTSPLLYVLADRPNPSRFDHLNPGAVPTPEIWALVSDLARSSVRLLVISDFWQAGWERAGPGHNGPLEDWLKAQFTEVARYGPYRVLTADL